jgi:adenylate cyclase
MNKLTTILLLLLSLSALSFILDRSGSFRSIEHTLLDDHFVRFQRAYPFKDVSLVMIDQASLREMGERLQVFWPWPREIHGIIAAYLRANGAERVVFDVLFDQPDFVRAQSSGADSDAFFAQNIATSGNVVLAAQLSDFITQSDEKAYQVAPKPPVELHSKFTSMPIPIFFDAAHTIGNAAIPTSYDAVIRYTQLFSYHDYIAIPALSVAALPFITDSITVKNQKVWFNQQISVPIQYNDIYLINWYKKGGVVDGTFPQFAAVRVLEKAIKWQRTGIITPDIALDVQGHTVFIGASAPGLADIKATPFSRLEPFPGVEIQATVFANLLHQDYLIPVPTLVKNLIIYAGIIVLILSVMTLRSKSNIPISLTILVGVTFLGVYLFAEHRIWFPTAQVLIMFTVTITAAFITRYVTEDKNKKWLKQAFTRYVPKELVDEVIKKPESLKLGGDKKELTVLFSDLAGFTTISEGMEPEELVPYLNEYLSEMTDLVFKHRGTLDKYIGDAIMAFWGAPLDDPDHAYNACACVIEMQELMKRLRVKWAKTGKPIAHTRYGVNSGKMVVGNVGSAERFNYTVLGDAVNLAARLEPANKNFGTQVMISETTYELVKDRFICRELDRLIVKGKSKPVKVYELMARANDSDFIQKHEKKLTHYRRALDLFFSRNFEEAEQEFMHILFDFPEDGPTLTYLNRINEFHLHPPDENWNGVFELKTK